MADRVRGPETVFRVAGLPPGATKDDATSIINQVCDNWGKLEPSCNSTVHSLGQDPYEPQTETVATVTFEIIPPQLVKEINVLVEEKTEFRGELIRMSLRFDIKFLGFTPLNKVRCPLDEVIDCIVVSGLASHAYGSWKSRKGHFMWLRDDAAWRRPNVRVMLYGYDTTLVKSESFQTIENIGTELGGALSRIRRNFQQGQVDTKPRPIVFIAHSLGGLVVKEAICKMSLSKNDHQRITASCVYGLIFFGVPNTGIRIEHWLPMVKHQPNEVLIRDLQPGAKYLLNLRRRFEAQFSYPKSKILSVFETMRTRTAKFDEGRWQITGPHKILVRESSATKPMKNVPEGISLYTMQMNQNHSDLPKFVHRHDLNYRNLIMELEGFWQDAISDVRCRFSGMTNHIEPEPRTAGPICPPEIEEDDNDSALKTHSDLSTKRTGSPLPLEDLRLVRYNHSSIRPCPAVLSPLHDFFQSHASGSAEDLSNGSALPLAVVDGRADVVSWFLSKGADVNLEYPDSDGGTLLHTAVENGHIDVVNILVGHGADVITTDRKGLTLMHLVPAGRSDIVQLLVGLGLDINEGDGNGNSALMLAVLQGQEERVQTFLINGADVNAAEPIPASIMIKNDTKLPPVLIAAHQKKTGVLKVLVEHGADLRPTFSEHGRTVLHCATIGGMHEAVQCLIDAKVDLDAQDESHFTALHIAADAGASALVQSLLDAGAEVEPRLDSLDTPLHLASQHGHLEVIQRLLDNGALIHSRDMHGETALHIACQYEGDTNLNVIKHLLERGASVLDPATDPGGLGRLPPHYAAQVGFKEAVEFFLEIGFDKGLQDAQGMQMIHYAASEGQLGVMEVLLERGVAASCGAGNGGEHPLHFAADEGHHRAVSMLCKFGADVNHQAWLDGCCPIHYAADHGHNEVISMLQKNGAEIDVLDDQKRTALVHALQEGHASTVALLCDYGASVSLGSWNGILEAACRGQADIVSILCKRVANIQIDPHTHDAALVEASEKGHVEVVRILLEHGADIEVRSKSQDWTPLHFAAHKNHKELVDLLLDNGANRKAVTKDGQTPRALAQTQGHHEVCKKLGRSPMKAQPAAGGKAPDSTSGKKAAASGEKDRKK